MVTGVPACRAVGLANTADHRAFSAPLASHAARSSMALFAAVSVFISRSPLVLLLYSQYSKREMKLLCKNLAKSDMRSFWGAVTQKKPLVRGLCVEREGGSVGRCRRGVMLRRVPRGCYSRPSSVSVSCSILINCPTSSGGISTHVVVTGRPADVLAVCLRPMSVLPCSTRVRTLVNWSRGAGVIPL